MHLDSCARISPVAERFFPGGESVGGAPPSPDATKLRLEPTDSRDGKQNAKNQDERVGAKADEDTLVRETLAGKRWAQKEVWCRFAPMVYGLLRRTLGSRHDHDDLMQEVFLRVFRRLHSLEKVSALRSFVYSVAIRVVSEEMRRFSAIRRVELQMMDIPRDRTSAGADFEARDILLRIQGILDGMKVKHRAVFVLRHVEGMDLYEISAGLGISLATVKRYLVKAMGCIEHAVARDEGLRTSLAWVMSSDGRGRR
jgi:RNA polymerase sigma-70 factor (ECF subfamily)